MNGAMTDHDFAKSVRQLVGRNTNEEALAEVAMLKEEYESLPPGQTRKFDDEEISDGIGDEVVSTLEAPILPVDPDAIVDPNDVPPGKSE